ncbi:lysophospholipid acyltransferase family protein [Halalkalibacterium halodurans]|uniref:Acyl-phosphate glycerol 3-phosphate acyltransferase n=1 Tax=Halalkalibacterium halodurans TaxID=86665 RepID=A0A0M0KKP5_ALKHA|nr:lysophospholipid acyltransferase family protein [Halalkalibacterium halodurans]TPE70560.1 1-acyl-sn-glycerol-3-phosphate acyltransferase [Halalkalibacterium halodurans]
MSIYSIGRWICRSYFRLFFKVEVIGVSRIPDEGGLLLCCNHFSNYDPPFVGSFFPRKVRFMAKEELFRFKPLQSLMMAVGAFPVRRGAGDKQALKVGLKLLKEGETLGIFPEGTRSKDGQIGKGLSGVGFFALRSDATVVPCAIVGKYRFFRKIRFVIGEPVPMEELKERKASAEEATEVIMKAIRKLHEQNHMS